MLLPGCQWRRYSEEMIIVTGGAGFIGSALGWALNERGRDDIIVVDDVDHDEKERNIGHLRYEEMVGIQEFREKLLAGDYDDAGIEGVIHMGACSSTLETDWEYLKDNNVEYSQDVIRWCHDRNIRCVYASSAATYGDGEQGYSDDHDLFDVLEPLNLYGKSKLDVDIWARDGGYLEKVVGIRYFNVFGPNEWHKEDMRSVICKKYPDVAAGKSMELFKSYKEEYADGEQKRDFVYVLDAIKATLWLFDTPSVNGVFNVGTGKARSWNDVAKAMYGAANVGEHITYIDMPLEMRDKYQYFTQADITKLRKAGYKDEFMSLEDAIADYIQKYLASNTHLGE